MSSGTLIKKLKWFNLIGVVNIVLWKKNCKNCGSTHRVSCPHTHQQNGVVERKHCHIGEIVLALLYHAKFPLQFWDDAFQTTCYLYNRLPSSTLKNLSPSKIFFNQIPNYNFLHVFGCECCNNLRPYNSNKLQSHSTQCVFLGYSLLHKGYKCLHLPSNHVYISHDVSFTETQFSFTQSISPHNQLTTLLDSSVFQVQPSIKTRLAVPLFVGLPSLVSNLLTTWPKKLPYSAHQVWTISLLLNLIIKKSVRATQSFLASTHIIPISQNPSASTHIIPITPNPSPTTDQPPSHPKVTQSNNHIIKPKKFTNGIVRYPLPSALLAKSTDVVSCPKPTCYTLAVKDPNWRAAMNLEFDALLKNQTWVLVPPHVARNPISCKWVFRIKQHADGSVEHYKACLEAKGFYQVPGMDFGETFSAIIKPTMVCTILSLAVSRGWVIRQFDV